MVDQLAQPTDVRLSNTFFGGGRYGGDIGRFAVLFRFLCGIPVNIIPHCGIAVFSCAMFVPAFKPTVFGKMKLCAVMRHGQI